MTIYDANHERTGSIKIHIATLAESRALISIDVNLKECQTELASNKFAYENLPSSFTRPAHDSHRCSHDLIRNGGDCFGDTCFLNSQNLTASFDVSGSSLTNVTFRDLYKTLFISSCTFPCSSYTINSTFTDTTPAGPVSGTVVYNGTTYDTNDVNNVLVLSLTATSGPLPATYTTVGGPPIPLYSTTTANGAFAMTGTITLTSFGSTIFTESLTGTGQVSISEQDHITFGPTFINSVFTFATPEPASSVLMSSGFVALFLGVMLKRRSVSRA